MMSEKIQMQQSRAATLVLTLVALLVVVLCGESRQVLAQGQWTTNPNGTDINNTNPGKVGIGTANPQSILHIGGSGAAITIDTPGAARGRVLTLPGVNNWFATTLNANYNSGWYLDSATSDGWFFKLDTRGRSGVAGDANGMWLFRIPAGANPHTNEYPVFGVTADRGAVGRLSAGYSPVSTFDIRSSGNTSSTFGLSVINGSNVTNLLVRDDGNVGIGTTTPTAKLDVQGGAVNASGGLCIAGDCKTAWSQIGSSASPWTTSGTSVFYNSGNVGIGTGSAAAKLNVYEPGLSAGTWKGRIVANGDVAAVTIGESNSVATIGGHTAALNNWSTLAINPGGGNVGIGTTAPVAKLDVAGNVNVTGDITATGNINAKYQDLAEWVPASGALPPGTVVVLDPGHNNRVTASSRVYDTRVAGVVSARPGIALGEVGEGKVLVATTGRVMVRVDATKAPIKIGDLIVTSNLPGAAMKSIPVELGGVSIHRPGTIVGKALEPLGKGVGEILVLLSLQ
jgi:hypothetical protein